MDAYNTPKPEQYELDQTIDLIEEYAQAAGDALADAAGALVYHEHPQRDRAEVALETAARHLYAAATLNGQLAAAGGASNDAALFRRLRETAESLHRQAALQPAADLRRVIVASLRLLETSMQPAPAETRARTQNFIQQVAANRAFEPANSNRASPQTTQLEQR